MLANDPMVVIDLQGRYLDANDAACRELGYSRAELLATSALQINRLTVEAWQATVAETMRLGNRVIETRYHCRDGRVVPVEASISVVDYQGRPAFLSIARNIERRKNAEAELVRRNIGLASLAADAAATHAASLAIPGSSIPDVHPTRPLDVILQAVIEQARGLVGFDNAAVVLYIPETGQFLVRFSQRNGLESLPAAFLPCTPALLDPFRQGQPVLLPDGAALRNLTLAPGSNGHSAGRRGMIVPLLIGERLVGAFSVGRDDAPGFAFADADRLQACAGQMSAAIDGSYILEGIRALAVSEERNRLSREMHDRMGQALAGAALHSACAMEMLEQGHTGKAGRALHEVSRALEQAYEDLRDAIYALRSTEAAPEDWVESLQQYARHYEQQWGIRCELQIGDGVAAACGAEGRVGLTRIMQEALTNVRKHAHSERARVSITVEDGSVVASITDEGQGFNPAIPTDGHYGLETMRERACSLGGQLRIASSPTGTHISVRVPVRYAA